MDNATRLREYVDAMFAALPRTQRAVEVKQGILESMQEHYDALITQGKSPDEALGAAIARFGSIDELRQELGGDDAAAAPAPAPATEPPGLREEYFGFMKTFSVMTAVAIGLFILAPMLFVLAEGVSETLSMVVFFPLIATGVIMLVYGGTRKESYQRRLGLDDKDRPLAQGAYAAAPSGERTPDERGGDLLSGGIYLLATVVFLTIGFTRGLWHPGWMVFLVATAIVMMIQGLRRR